MAPGHLGAAAAATAPAPPPACRYVDDPRGTAHAPNVVSKIRQRRAKLRGTGQGGQGGAGRDPEWPCFFASEDIPAGCVPAMQGAAGRSRGLTTASLPRWSRAQLFVSYGDGFWERLAARRALLRELVRVAAVGVSHSAVARHLSGRSGLSIRPSCLDRWEPLFRRVRSGASQPPLAPASALDLGDPLTHIDLWALSPRRPSSYVSQRSQRAMFSFPAALVAAPPSQGSLRYRPSDIPLKEFAMPDAVGACREASGRIVIYARKPIPRGRALAWCEGLLVRSPRDLLLAAHPYATLARASGSVIMDPLFWASHVEPGPWPNVAIASVPLPVGGPTDGGRAAGVYEWPVLVATRNISAREELALQVDDGHAAAEARGARIFSQLARLVAGAPGHPRAHNVDSGDAQLPLSHHEIRATLAAEFGGSADAIDLERWAPLFEELRASRGKGL